MACPGLQVWVMLSLGWVLVVLNLSPGSFPCCSSISMFLNIVFFKLCQVTSSLMQITNCLLYTSDAADDYLEV